MLLLFVNSMIICQVAVKIVMTRIAIFNLTFNKLLPHYFLKLLVLFLEFNYAKGRLAKDR